jgi:hypothetical protein
MVGGSRSAVHLFLLTPSHFPLEQFHEIALHGQKKLHKIQEIVKKVYDDKA